MNQAAEGRDEAPQFEGALVRAGLTLARLGLTWGTSGNVSARLDATRFLVSPSGVALDRLGESGLSLCRVDGGHEAGPPPSVERRLHAAVYAACPEAGAALHVSPPWATLVACSRERVAVRAATDWVLFAGALERVPYRPPGSAELAEAAAAVATRSRTMLLDQHGILVWGAAVEEAVVRAEAVELACRMHVTARAAGIELVELTDDEAGRLTRG